MRQIKSLNFFKMQTKAEITRSSSSVHFSCINRVKGCASLWLTIGAPVGSFIAQPCENENQSLESLAEK